MLIGLSEVIKMKKQTIKARKEQNEVRQMAWRVALTITGAVLTGTLIGVVGALFLLSKCGLF